VRDGEEAYTALQIPPPPRSLGKINKGHPKVNESVPNKSVVGEVGHWHPLVVQAVVPGLPSRWWVFHSLLVSLVA
jgi:hypothetical protein